MQDLIQTFGWVLLHFLWQGSLVGGVAWMGLRYLEWKCSNSEIRYFFLCSCLLLCAFCPVITWIWLSYLGPATNSIAQPVGAMHVIASNGSIDERNDAVDRVSYESLGGPVLNYVRISETLRTALPFVILAWMLGVIFSTLRLILDYSGIKRMSTEGLVVSGENLDRFLSLKRRMGVDHAVLLIESVLVEIPTVIGWMKPIVVVPVAFFTSLPPDQIEAILAHELAHIRRWDHVINLFQMIIETALFYHPAIWWLSRSIRDERETCCDELAISIVGDRCIYASALATFESNRILPGEAVLSANGGSLLKRVQRVFGECDPDSLTLKTLIRNGYRGLALGIVMFAIVGAVSFATSQGTTTNSGKGYLAKNLVRAAQDGDLQAIENLLAQGASPDANVRPSGNNALFTAVTHNKLEAVKLLVRFGAHVDTENVANQRPIDWALATGNLEMASWLRAHGSILSPASWAAAAGDVRKLKHLVASGDLKQGSTDNVMRIAVSMGRLDAVKFLELLENKPVAGRFLVAAASAGNVSMLEYIWRKGEDMKKNVDLALEQAVVIYDQPKAAIFLLAHGANPNRFTRWERFILSQAKTSKMIRILLEAGANPNNEDMLGSPLSNAPDAASVRLLVEYGADINRTKSGAKYIVQDTIIRSRHDQPEVIKELVTRGAELKSEGNGIDALIMAVQRDDTKVAKYLLNFGVNPGLDFLDANLKSSPLGIGVMVSSWDTVRILLASGSPANKARPKSITPLSLALSYGNWDMVNLLRKAGARDVCDLSVAAAFGDVAKVSDLIKRGNDVNKVDESGRSPLFYATQRRQLEVVELLLRHGAIASDISSPKT